MPKPTFSLSSAATSMAATSAAIARAAATTATTMIHPQVLHDLALAVLEASSEADGSSDSHSDFHDTYLIASDGKQVAACRFILAARSSVLKKMLYGNFREAKASTICMVGYDSRTLQAVVDYCYTNTLNLRNNKTNDNNNKSSSSVMIEQLVQIYNAADFLDLKGLATLAEREIRKQMSACPSLACLVLNQAATDSTISQYALQMIEVRPYVALDNSSSANNNNICMTMRGGGGVECLQPEWLLYILKSQSIAAGEFFLFCMLNRWYEHHVNINKGNHKQKSASTASSSSSSSSSSLPSIASATSTTTASSCSSPLDVAYQCAKYIQFDNIEPQILLDDALQKKCPWMNPTWIFDAVAKQALRASQDRIWSIQCRGGGGGGSSANGSSSSASCNAKSRILVEGAGNPNANGIYYLSISGLSRGGDLYSKREISVGQEYVYTLSCRLAPNDDDDDTSAMVECRIFCSKLLSHAAISTLHDIQQFNRIRGHLDPVFQPILQILSVEAPLSPSLTNNQTPTNHHQPTPLHDTFYRVQVSDGDWTMPGTLAPTPHLRELIQRGDLVENSIIQVLDFGLYLTNSNDSGSSSNNDMSSCCCLHIQRASIVNANPGQEFGTPKPFVYQGGTNSNSSNETTTVDDSISEANSTGSYGESGNGGIQNLYTCTYPLDRQPRDDTKIPRTGWLVAEHGQGPAPTCTWIPGLIRRDTVATAPASSVAAAVLAGSSGTSVGSFNARMNTCA